MDGNGWRYHLPQLNRLISNYVSKIVTNLSNCTKLRLNDNPPQAKISATLCFLTFLPQRFFEGAGVVKVKDSFVFSTFTTLPCKSRNFSFFSLVDDSVFFTRWGFPIAGNVDFFVVVVVWASFTIRWMVPRQFTVWVLIGRGIAVSLAKSLAAGFLSTDICWILPCYEPEPSLPKNETQTLSIWIIFWKMSKADCNEV